MISSAIPWRWSTTRPWSGCPRTDATNTDSGAVLVFTRDSDGRTGTQSAKLKASDAASYDGFGSSVAFDGATIVVGAPDDDDGGNSSGAAYVFTKPTSAAGWADSIGTETAKLTASQPPREATTLATP